MENFTKVDGKNKGKVLIYTLSTCIWCRKVKSLLKDLEVEYYYLDMDEIPKEAAAATPACRWAA